MIMIMVMVMVMVMIMIMVMVMVMVMVMINISLRSLLRKAKRENQAYLCKVLSFLLYILLNQIRRGT